jgi:hypothetical protein
MIAVLLPRRPERIIAVDGDWTVELIDDDRARCPV